VSKKSKRVSARSKMPIVKLVLVVAVIALGVWAYFTYFTTPTSGRHSFTSTQFVGNLDGAYCVHITYSNKDYCVDDWAKVYNVMDGTNQATSTKTETTVKVVFDADFHTGTKQFIGDTDTPTIFLDKVYSATATKQ